MSIHFIGIGGIGISALAKYYLTSGEGVSGSDLVSSEITDELAHLGAKIKIGRHKRTNLPPKTGKVVYTAAVKPENPELMTARRRRIAVQSYPEAVGELTRHLRTITVSGAHGKSTTTALIGLILEEAYLDPTVIVGTKVKEFGNSNFRKGRGPWLVLEADEWARSFLHYSPAIALITNIDAEHLDTYGSIDGVTEAFAEYLARVPPDGAVVANYDDPRVRRIASASGKRVVWYSGEDREHAMLKGILRVPGEHNISNALAALALGRFLGIRDADALRALARFSGAWRRFEFKGITEGAFVFSDYAHHPTEIRATILAARSRFPLRRIWCVYQPHQHTRLMHLWGEFLTAFDGADRVCLLPVYDVAGRETREAKKRVDAKKLTHSLGERGKHVQHLNSFSSAKRYIQMHARPGDVILVMGAGDIHELANALAR